MFIALKPLGSNCTESSPSCAVRQTSAMDVINRLRPKMNRLPVASAFLQPAQHAHVGTASYSVQLYNVSMYATAFRDFASHGATGVLHDLREAGG